MKSSIRRMVLRRARGRCEYCRSPFRFEHVPPEIDHIIAHQHGGATAAQNLAMACAHCNCHKGPNISGIDPRTRLLSPLFNPRTDAWAQHFRWHGAILVGLSVKGRATIRVLAINAPTKLIARASLMDEGVF